MSNVKIPTSTSYQQRLIESLQDPISQRERFANEAAAYLEVTLERDLEDPVPDLLRSVLTNIVAAKEQVGELSIATKDLHASLDRVLAESKGVEIYGLIDLLAALGFRLSVVPKDE
jgi:DNA-binding phage protein